MPSPKFSRMAPLIEDAIRRGLLVRMREINWRKRGLGLYYNDFPPPTKVCEVEVEETEDGARLSLRFGVWFPKVARLAQAVHERGLPPAAECTVQVGLAELVAKDQNAWKKLRGPRDVDAVAEHLSWAWRTHGIPWIEQHSELEAALEHLLDRGDRFPAAAVSLMLGRKEEAADLLTAEIFENPLHAARLTEWGRRSGIL